LSPHGFEIAHLRDIYNAQLYSSFKASLEFAPIIILDPSQLLRPIDWLIVDRTIQFKSQFDGGDVDI
jgi:hypothetical protein